MSWYSHQFGKWQPQAVYAGGQPDPNAKVKSKSDHSDDVTLKKGTEIHRIVPKDWVENEKTYKGHAYASHKPEDVEKYKHYANVLQNMLGQSGTYSDMTFKANKKLVSPGKDTRVKEFVDLLENNKEVKDYFKKTTLNPMHYVSRKTLNHIVEPKYAEKAYSQFEYLLVSKPKLRDAYFSKLTERGYNMIIDDADVRGGISKEPIIVFDRSNLSLQKVEDF